MEKVLSLLSVQLVDTDSRLGHSYYSFISLIFEFVLYITLCQLNLSLCLIVSSSFYVKVFGWHSYWCCLLYVLICCLSCLVVYIDSSYIVFCNFNQYFEYFNANYFHFQLVLTHITPRSTIAGILLSCAASSNLELCAMATAKLHTLVQTRCMKDAEEGGYLLYYINTIVQQTLQG